MTTYFARHGSKLNIDEATYQKLWDEHLVAIHYPTDRTGPQNADSESTDPADYNGTSGGVLRRLRSLARNGGYVCGVYKGHSGCVVGYVEPGSEVVLVRGARGSKEDAEGREAVLKAVRLSRARHLGPAESAALLSARPRQGTFCAWHKAGQMVHDLVEGGAWLTSAERLTPTLQEVLCSELLRLPVAEAHGLPRMESSLVPVGRTLKDVDVLGLSPEGQFVAAQVTNYEANSDQAQSKLSKLAAYGSSNGGDRPWLVLFCQADAPEERDGVLVFPLERAFELFTASAEGQRWVRAVSQTQGFQARIEPAGASESRPPDSAHDTVLVHSF